MDCDPSMMEEARRSWEEEEAFERTRKDYPESSRPSSRKSMNEPEPDENQKEESGIVKKTAPFH